MNWTKFAGELGRYPATRLRRNRQSDWNRRLVAETSLSASDLVWPVFVIEGEGRREPVTSMPGVDRLTIDILLDEAARAEEAGIPAIALFPQVDPALKTDDGDEALRPDNLICRAVSALKSAGTNIGLICDVALDPYTSHGQDGLIRNGLVANDATVARLTAQACLLAAAGADIVAPSDMMDGRVGAIRQALDEKGHESTGILSYAAKYASAFYGPFREAIGSASALGQADKRTYQMDPANGDEALREVALDLAEGADMVLVKPGTPYLDILSRIRAAFPVPVLAYQVSGEYAALMAAQEKGWLDGDAALIETLQGFKRAGAAAVFTYGAPAVAARLKTG
ncbi:MAG: porphobilinogen synthase [Alphaproteobacteria bacterium]